MLVARGLIQDMTDHHPLLQEEILLIVEVEDHQEAPTVVEYRREAEDHQEVLIAVEDRKVEGLQVLSVAEVHQVEGLQVVHMEEAEGRREVLLEVAVVADADKI